MVRILFTLYFWLLCTSEATFSLSTLKEDANFFETALSNDGITIGGPKEEYNMMYQNPPVKNSFNQCHYIKDITGQIRRIWESNGGKFPDWMYSMCRDESARKMLDDMSRAYAQSKETAENSVMERRRPEETENNMKQHSEFDVNDYFRKSIDRNDKNIFKNQLLKSHLNSGLNNSMDVNMFQEDNTKIPKTLSLNSNASEIFREIWKNHNGNFPVWMYNICHDKKSRKVLDNLERFFRNESISKQAQTSANKFPLFPLKDSYSQCFDSFLASEEKLHPQGSLSEYAGNSPSWFMKNVKTLKSVPFNPVYYAKKVRKSHKSTTDSYERKQIKDFLSIIKQITAMGLTLEEVDNLSKNPKSKEFISSSVLDDSDNILHEINKLDKIQGFGEDMGSIDVSKTLDKLTGLVSDDTDEKTKTNLRNLFNRVKTINNANCNHNKEDLKHYNYMFVILCSLAIFRLYR